jgi:hypothetical protein
MSLKDDLAAIKTNAAKQRDAEREKVMNSSAELNKVRDKSAVDAILSMLSDDSVRKIVEAHASKGGADIATIGIQNKKVSLMRIVAPGTIGQGHPLEMSFDGEGLIASQRFNDAPVAQRIAELFTDGVSVTSKYDIKHDVLTITYDYSRS